MSFCLGSAQGQRFSHEDYTWRLLSCSTPLSAISPYPSIGKQETKVGRQACKCKKNTKSLTPQTAWRSEGALVRASAPSLKAAERTHVFWGGRQSRGDNPLALGALPHFLLQDKLNSARATPLPFISHTESNFRQGKAGLDFHNMIHLSCFPFFLALSSLASLFDPR